MSEELKDVLADTGDVGGDVYDVHDAASLFEEEVSAELGEGQGEPVTEEPTTAEPEQEMSEYPMPEGWEEAMWQGATHEVRGKIDSMVKSHAEALAVKEKPCAKPRPSIEPRL